MKWSQGSSKPIWVVDSSRSESLCPGEASGSSRTLVATNHSDRWLFVFGFEKNERANINAKEFQALKTLAADLLKLTPEQTKRALAQEVLQEICHEEQNQSEKPHP
jgi:hypothetical protein